MEDTREEVLEAEQVYLLMKKEYRLSRNIRAEWYFSHLNQVISLDHKNSLADCAGELDVISVIPNLDSCTRLPTDPYCCRYKVIPSTVVTFFARRYRIVFALDISPSAGVVDIQSSQVLFDGVFNALKNCLIGLTKPFHVPGVKLLFSPQLYVTVIAHTPFITSSVQQVLVQGFFTTQDTVGSLLESVRAKLSIFEHAVAEMAAITNEHLQAQIDAQQRIMGGLFDDAVDRSPSPCHSKHHIPMMMPDASFINMLRYGILGLQLLPENTSAGIIVITDGITGSPDIHLLESLLTQLRNSTIACSFLPISSHYHPSCSQGYIPYLELMLFISAATFGSYIEFCPNLEDDNSHRMNVYHRAALAWSFQKALPEYKFMGDCLQSSKLVQWDTDNANFKLCAPEEELLRKMHCENKLGCDLASVLSVRLREGYTIKNVELAKGDSQIDVSLIMPWKHNINIEYKISSPWPLHNPKRCAAQIEVTIEGSYDFLHDFMCPGNKPQFSTYRTNVMKRFWHTLQGLSQTDQLLLHFQSFNTTPAHYTLPDTVKKGVPLFYLTPTSTAPVLSAQDAAQRHSPFVSFWKPICMLDINIWQKWMHTHRIGIILAHDIPLPKYLHLPSSTGRYNIIQCRQALMALNEVLKDWSTFSLVENHSYIKFLSSGVEGVPKSFIILRVTSKPPCMVLRLAFQGGTPGCERNEIVNQLREKILGLTFSLRGPQESQNRGQIQRLRSQVDCCVLLAKPVEKILIRYEKLPADFLLDLHYIYSNNLHSRHNLQRGASNAVASSMFTTLSRYLYHHRWVWGVQNETAYPVGAVALGRMLSTLTKIRLREGFHFANTNSGVVNMVLEVKMKNVVHSDRTPLCSPVAKEPDATKLDETDEAYSCVVQYILFPPHTAVTHEMLSEDDIDPEFEGADTEGELQIITECWVEPQDGCVYSSSDEQLYLNGSRYNELAKQLFPLDNECISTTLTFEHLSVLCQKEEFSDLLQPNEGMPLYHTTTEPSIEYIPFQFDLMKIVPKCQQMELLFCTFIQDVDLKSGSRCRDASQRPDENSANNLLFDLFFEKMEETHDAELHLTNEFCANFPLAVKNRARDLDTFPLPFKVSRRTNICVSSETLNKSLELSRENMLLKLNIDRRYSSMTKDSDQGSTSHSTARGSLDKGTGDVTMEGDDARPSVFYGRWRCFVKAFSKTHIILTFIPASYGDLKAMLRDDEKDEVKSLEIDGVEVANGVEVFTTAENTSNEQCKQSTKQSLTLPVYVYDCPLSVLNNYFLDGQLNRSATHEDIYEDRTFKTTNLYDADDGLDLHKEDEGSKLSSPEPRSEDSTHDRTDELRNHTSNLVNVYCDSFVLGIFRSLQYGFEIDSQDVQSAVDAICEELLLEIDITKFLLTVCGHCKDFQERMIVEHAVQEAQKTPMRKFSLPAVINDVEDSHSSDNEKTISSVPPALHPVFTFPLSYLKKEKKICESKQGLHKHIREQFAELWKKAFKPIPSNPDFFFYCPPSYQKTMSVIDDDDPSREIQIPAPLRSTGDDDLVEFKSTSHDDTATSGTVMVESSLNELIDRKSDTHLTNVSPSEAISSLFGDEARSDMSSDEDDQVPPLFIHMTSSIKWSGNHASQSSTSLPMCLNDLIECLGESETLDLNEVLITLDIICLTLPYDQQQGQRLASDKTNTYASTSSLEETGTGQCDTAFVDEGYPSETVGDALASLPDFQHQSVVNCVDQIKWLIRNEIISAMRYGIPITTEVLEQVASHVQDSQDKENCRMEQVPLILVYGPDQSIPMLTEEFERMNLVGYQILKEGDYYYVAMDRTRVSSLMCAHMPSEQEDASSSSSIQVLNNDEDEEDDDEAQLTVKSKSEIMGESGVEPSADQAKEEVSKNETPAAAAEIAKPADSNVVVADASDQLVVVGQKIEVAEDASVDHGQSGTTEEPGKDVLHSLHVCTSDKGHEEKTESLVIEGPSKEVQSEASETSIGFRDVADSPKISSELNTKAHADAVEISQQQSKDIGKKGIELGVSEIGSFTTQGESEYHGAKGRQDEINGLLLDKNDQSESLNKHQRSDALVSSESIAMDAEIHTSTEGPKSRRLSETRHKRRLQKSKPMKIGRFTVLPTNQDDESTSSSSCTSSMHSRKLPIILNNKAIKQETLGGEASSTEAGAVTFFEGEMQTLPRAEETPTASWVNSTQFEINAANLNIEGTHEQGYDGDTDTSDSDADDNTDHVEILETNVKLPSLPKFWLIIKIDRDRVVVYLHSRDSEVEDQYEIEESRRVFQHIVNKIDEMCKLVNQCLLLQNLLATHMCNPLLVPEAEEDITWKQDLSRRYPTKQFDTAEDEYDSMSESSGPHKDYLAASLRFRPGHFACERVWETYFFLHPRLKTGPAKSGVSRGIQALRSVLNAFSVNNRKNMFVLESSGNVFYLRLNDLPPSTSIHNPPHSFDHETYKGSEEFITQESRSSSSMSLTKRDTQEDDTMSVTSHGRVSRTAEDCVVLSAHGIAVPGPEIKEELVQVLQNRLDEAVLDVITAMFARNPMYKLTPEDVHFIQKPGEPPNFIKLFTVPSHILMYLHALGHYLRQNLLHFLHTPKYVDNRPENHFQVFTKSNDGNKPSTPYSEYDVFVYNRPPASGQKGIACIGVSFVDSAARPIEVNSCPKLLVTAWSSQTNTEYFNSLIATDLYTSDSNSEEHALIQFSIWERGVVDVAQLTDKLCDAIRNSLCDFVTEYSILTAPIAEIIMEDPSPSPLMSEPASPVAVSTGKDSVSSWRKIMQETFTAKLFSQRFLYTAEQSVHVSANCRAFLSTSAFHYIHADYSPSSVQDDSTGSIAKSRRYESGDRGVVHQIYHSVAPAWLDYCVKRGVPAVHKHTCELSCHHSVELVLREFQNQVMNLSDTLPKMFREVQSSVETKGASFVPYSPRPPVLTGESRQESSVDHEVPPTRNYIVVGRNTKQWRASQALLKGEDNIDFPSLLDAKTRKGLQRFNPLQPAASSQDGQCSHADGDLPATTGFVPRQRLLILTVRNKCLSLYVYNWSQELTQRLEKQLTRLVQWHKARGRLLTSIVSQKMGLFHHARFVYEHGSEQDKDKDVNPYLYSANNVEMLVKHLSPPLRDSLTKGLHSSVRSGNLRTMLPRFDEVLRNERPAQPLYKCEYDVPSTKDPVAMHGSQLLEVRRDITMEAEKALKVEKLYLMWQHRASHSHVPITLEDLEVLKQSSRLFHFCATPLLFSPQWRRKAAIHKTPTVFHLCGLRSTGSGQNLSKQMSDDSKPRSRQSSGGSGKVKQLQHQRTDSSDSKRSQDDPGGHRIVAEDTWHIQLRQSFIQEFIQYMTSLGYCVISTKAASPQPKSASKPKPHSPDVKRKSSLQCTECYLQRTMPGGIILVELKYREPFFMVCMFALECSRLLGSNILMNQFRLMFIDECDKDRVRIHTHSFAYDFHLRTIHSYISGRMLILKKGYHLTSFMNDFINYYQKSPGFARNDVHSGTVEISNLITPANKLWEYMLNKDRLYDMNVMRMAPLQTESDIDLAENEYILVSLFSCRGTYKDLEDTSQFHEFDVALLTVDSSDPQTAKHSSDSGTHTLLVKYYIIITSRRELFPKITLENTLGMFRIVPASGPNAEPPGKMSLSSRLGLVHIRQESAKYLGYYSHYETHLRSLLLDEAFKAEKRIKNMVSAAVGHCRRDILWHRLLVGVATEEEKARKKSKVDSDDSSKEGAATKLMFAEFKELLNSVVMINLDEIDKQLSSFLCLHVSWYQSLCKVLIAKFGETVRQFISQDGSSQYVVVLNPNVLDMFMMVTVDLNTNRSGLYAVYREPIQSEGITNGRPDWRLIMIPSHIESFINVCCFHLWTGLLH